MKKTISLLLILSLFASSLIADTKKDSQKKEIKKTASKKKAGSNKVIDIKGTPIVEKKNNQLLKELKKEQYRSSRTRRFEIVFFISLPVTLWITYSLMELMVKNSKHQAGYNPNRELQTPHYIYMFSTTLLTSFYIAYQDMITHPPHHGLSAAPNEKRVDVPVLGIKF